MRIEGLNFRCVFSILLRGFKYRMIFEVKVDCMFWLVLWEVLNEMKMGFKDVFN